MRWNVDVKAEPALHPLLNLIGRTDAWDRVCVGSFSEARVFRAQRLAGPRLATSYGTKGVVGLRLRSYGIPAALRDSAVAAQVPESQSGFRWSTGASSAPPTRAACRSTSGRSTNPIGCTGSWTWESMAS